MHQSSAHVYLLKVHVNNTSVHTNVTFFEQEAKLRIRKDLTFMRLFWTPIETKRMFQNNQNQNSNKKEKKSRNIKPAKTLPMWFQSKEGRELSFVGSSGAADQQLVQCWLLL